MIKPNTILGFARKHVIVLGDTMLDKYTNGGVHRVSQEAPVPIIQLESTIANAGAAAHTALAVAGLGAKVSYVSLSGDDVAANELGAIFDKSKRLKSFVFADKKESTLVRHRIMSGDSMMLRMDSGTHFKQGVESQAHLSKTLESLWPTADAIIISDYGYGVLSDEVLRTVEELMKVKKIILTVDSRNLERFSRLCPDLVKPNETEAISLLGLPCSPKQTENIDILGAHSGELLGLTGSCRVALTLGARGVLCMQKDQENVHVAPPFVSKMQESGAGDSFIAAATLALTVKMPLHAMAHLANSVAVMSIDKGSTGICTTQDLEDLHSPSKLISAEKIQALLDLRRREGKTIVFTNGCFDLLHPGHVKLLGQAKAEGDILVVGVNSDDSVRRLKGEARPINTLEDRCAVLAGLAAVDYLVPFEEDTPEELLKLIKPHVFVKAGYRMDQLPEASIIKKHNGKIKLFETVPGSTTETIARIQG